MQETKVKCKICGSPYIQNKSLQLCKECVYKKNHDGKSRIEVALERRKSRPLKNRTYRKKPRKPTGERDLFLKIWEQRPHICVRCGKFLGNEPKAIFFSHILPKSTHPEKRLDPDNIELLCGDCHYRHEFVEK